MDSHNNVPDSLNAPSLGNKPSVGNVKSRRGSFIFGFIVIIFSLIGLLSCIFWLSGLMRSSAKQKEEGDFGEYDKFLIAVAAVDPAPFDDISTARMNELVEISVWSIIRSDLEPDKYDYSSGELAIPASDIEAAFIRYFGTQLPIVHQTVTGYGYEFSYNSDDGCYYIPLTTIEPLYTPSVRASETKGDTVILTLGMVNANTWKQDTDSGDLSRPEPDKYVKVTLRKSGGSFFIAALQTTSYQETAIVEVFTTKPAEQTTATEQTNE